MVSLTLTNQNLNVNINTNAKSIIENINTNAKNIFECQDQTQRWSAMSAAPLLDVFLTKNWSKKKKIWEFITLNQNNPNNLKKIWTIFLSGALFNDYTIYNKSL